MPRDLAGVREGQYCRQPCLALLCPARGQPQGLHGSPSPPGCILGHSGDRGATVLGGADRTGAGICRSPAAARSRRGPCRSGAICLWQWPRTNEFEGHVWMRQPLRQHPCQAGRAALLQLLSERAQGRSERLGGGSCSKRDRPELRL